MKVLVSIQQPVKQWQVPFEGVETLRTRFPHVRFIHATTPEQRAEGLADCDIAYTWILRDQEAAKAPKLKWVHTSAVAVETLCLPELFARNIAVSNTRGVQAVPIAEHVMAVTLALAKQIPFAVENQQEARWAQNEFMGARLPWLLKGRTLGLVGVGTIGSEIAKRAGEQSRIFCQAGSPLSTIWRWNPEKNQGMTALRKSLRNCVTSIATWRLAYHTR